MNIFAPFTDSTRFKLLNATYVIHAIRHAFRLIKIDNEELKKFNLDAPEHALLRDPLRSPTNHFDDRTVHELYSRLMIELAGKEFYTGANDDTPRWYSPFPFEDSHLRPVFNLFSQIYLEPYVGYQLITERHRTMARYRIQQGDHAIFRDLANARKVDDTTHPVFERIRDELTGTPIRW